MRMTYFLILAISTVLAGCAKEPPQCSAPETVALAKQVIASQFKNLGANLRYFSDMAFGDPDVAVSDEMLMKLMDLENPISTSVNKEIKKVTCQATLTTQVDKRGQFFTAVPVTYFSQLDDKNDQVVGLSANETEMTKYLMGLYSAVAKNNPSLVKKKDESSVPSAISNNVEPEIKASAAAQVSMSSSERPAWCLKASTFVEKTICNDAELSKLDLEMGKLYAKAKATTTDQAAFQKDSKNWLANQRNTCTDRDCLVKSAQNRISELNSMLK